MEDNKISICDTVYSLTLNEVSHSFGVSSQTIVEIVEEGIVNVEQPRPEEWIFDSKALQDIHTVLSLHKDLGINFAGAALALELLKEIHRLKSLLPP